MRAHDGCGWCKAPSSRCRAISHGLSCVAYILANGSLRMPLRHRFLGLAIGVSALCLSAGAGPAVADNLTPDGKNRVAAYWPVPKARPPEKMISATKICTLIAQSADKYGLPPEFFARLIWKESRFDTRAISPVGALGVAQFMPTTARIRGLKDPYDPEQAIPASAHFLADLRARFGNLGLAAAAYNGGPDRVARWVAKGGGWLPAETVDYVYSITYRPVDWFREKDREVEPRPLEKGKDFMSSCAALPVMKTRALAASPSGARAPWGVQIAAGISRRAAMRAFRRARARLRSVVGGRGAILVRQGRKGVRAYSARVGASSRSAARKLCGRIRAIGGACVVRKN